MLLGGWLLASLGCPVLVLFTAFSVLAGEKGLLIAFIDLYLATFTVYFFVSKVSVRLRQRYTLRSIGSHWLYMSAAMIPFWPFVAFCAARGIALSRVYLAIAAVSTPTLAIFSVSLLLGKRMGISPLWIALGAAGVTIVMTRIYHRWTKKAHGDILTATGLQRRDSPR